MCEKIFLTQKNRLRTRLLGNRKPEPEWDVATLLARAQRRVREQMQLGTKKKKQFEQATADEMAAKETAISEAKERRRNAEGMLKILAEKMARQIGGVEGTQIAKKRQFQAEAIIAAREDQDVMRAEIKFLEDLNDEFGTEPEKSDQLWKLAEKKEMLEEKDALLGLLEKTQARSTAFMMPVPKGTPGEVINGVHAGQGLGKKTV